MAASDALPARIGAIRDYFVERLRRDRGTVREPTPPPPSPWQKPLIARAAVWPPPPPRALGLDEFGLLSPAARAVIAAILEPALADLRAAIFDRLADRPGPGAPEQRIARAIAGNIGRLADLIEAIDRYNDTPGSGYRIEPGLKSFLVECALSEIEEAACARLAAAGRREAAIAA